MNRFSKVLSLVLVGLFLVTSLAFAAQLAPVQDVASLPTSGNTIGDVRTVTLLSENYTYTSVGCWYPTNLSPVLSATLAPITAVTYATGVMSVSDLPTTDADNVCRTVYSEKKVYKSTSGTWVTLDSVSPSPLVVVQKLAMPAARLSDVGGIENFLDIGGYLTGTGNTGGNANTYGINVSLARLNTANITAGTGDDAGLKIRLANYGRTNIAGTTMRGADISVKNRGSSAFITSLNGANVSAQTDSGGSTTNVTGLYVSNDLDGTVTALSLPLDVRSFRQSAGVPTLEAIARFRNGNTTGTGIATGILITSEAGAPAGIVNVIDMSGATVTGADVKLSGTVNVYSGVAVTRAAVQALAGPAAAPVGSIFIGQGNIDATKPNMYIKNTASTWVRIVTQDSD